jgi:hypothetical protein
MEVCRYFKSVLPSTTQRPATPLRGAQERGGDDSVAGLCVLAGTRRPEFMTLYICMCVHGCNDAWLVKLISMQIRAGEAEGNEGRSSRLPASFYYALLPSKQEWKIEEK